MKMRKILYEVGSAGRNELMLKISEELKKRMDHQVFFLCGKENRNFLEQRISTDQICMLDTGGQTAIIQPDLLYLQQAEQKFGFNIWDSWEVSAQRKKSRRNLERDKILIWYEHILRQLEQFIDKYKITDYVEYGPASYASVIIMKVMEKKGVNIIELQSAPLQKRFAICNSLRNNWPELSKNYRELKKNGLTEKEKAEVVSILEQYHTKHLKPDCAVSYSEQKLHKAFRYSKIGYRMIREWHFPPTFRPLFWGVIQKAYDRMGIFENPVPGEKYILYPLHFQPEAATLIYGKWYNNQLHLLENLVRSLPVGYKLYVKEHSYGYGNRSLKFCKEIRKYANVRLITPHVNSLELIEKASLIVTITGTPGWESLMFQKPPLIFGNIFYDIFDCAHKVEKIEDLPEMIRNLLDQKINHEEILIILAAMLKSTYPGLARLPSDCNCHSLEEENIQLLAQGIDSYIASLN